MTMTSKERALNVLQGKPVDVVPVFSGFGNVIVDGLKKYNLRFAHVHLDAQEMADAAGATVELVGTDAAVVPFDMGVAPEALGATLNTYPHSEDILYPTLRDKYIHTADDIKVPADMSQAGRVPLVCEAIKKLKAKFGEEVAVGSWVLGPFTLAGQSMDLNEILKMTFKEPDKANAILSKLTEVLIGEAKAYEAAGADFISVREMGATSDVLSPRTFKKLIRGFSEQIVKEIKVPSIYHICGSNAMIIEDMAAMGANAISVDQKNDLKVTREQLGDDAIILGNVHPWDVLSQGTPDQIAEATKEAGQYADAIWPGCDLWPDTKLENLKAWAASSRELTPRRKA